MLKAHFFHRNFMIRRWEHVRERLSFDNKDFSMIESSIFHYLPEDQTDTGPIASDIVLNNISGNVYIDHVFEFSQPPLGNTRDAQFRPNTFIRDYHKQNRTIRRNRNTETVLRNKRNLLIYNYAPLQSLVHYRPTYMVSYHKWYNTFNTAIDKLIESLKTTDRQQILRIQLPENIPSLTALNRASRKLDQQTINNFKGFKKLTILDIWTLLSDDPSTSLLSKIPEEYWSRVTIILQGDRWAALTLGMLRGISEETEEDAVERDQRTARKYILRLLIELQSESSEGLDEEDEEEVETELIVTKTDKVTDNVVIDDVEDEPPVPVARRVKVIEKTEEELDEELDAIEKMKEKRLQLEDIKSVEDIIAKKSTKSEDDFKERAEELADEGRISAPEYKRALALVAKQNSIKAPIGDQSFNDFIKIDEKDVIIPESNIPKQMDGVFTETLLSNRGDLVKETYIKEIFPKDVSRNVANLQRAGVSVTGAEHKKVESVIGGYEIYSFKLSPITGLPSTVNAKFPIVDDDGTFLVNGNRYYLRWQRGDLPIRKTKPHEVALTSYYGKVFITRSDKVVDNYSMWLIKQITAQSINKEQKVITDIKLSDVFIYDLDVPRIYSILSQGFTSFTVGGYKLHFDYRKRDTFFTPDEIKKHEKNKRICIGKGKGGIVVADDLNNFYHIKEDKETYLGFIEDLTEGILGTPPNDVAEINILGKSIPIGFVLGYLEGFTTLLKVIGANSRKVQSGQALNLQKDEYAIRFADESYIFSRDDQYASLIFSGFNRYKRQIQHFSSREFNKKDVYKTILEGAGLSSRYLREVELMHEMFVDPITLDLLKSRKEPETFEGLVYHSTELLLTDWHPHETDIAYQRLKSHERFAGIFYNELVRSVRQYKNNPIKGKAKIDLNPEAVYTLVCSEGSMSKQNNPLHNIREKDDITFTGFGGRSAESMTIKSKTFYKNDLGVISEHAPDSSKVGISSYLTYNPAFNSLRGTVDIADPKTVGAGEMFSVGVITKASSDKDDPKRANFSSIQDGSTIASIGYVPSPVRTGAEKTIAHRVDDTFATTSKMDGVVTDVTDDFIYLKHKDGSTKVIELGIEYGVDADKSIPHHLVSNVKKGHKFKQGEVLAYGADFFVPDPLDPTQVVNKSGNLATVCIWENSGTFEDSCEISADMAAAFTSITAKKSQVTVDFTQGIKDLVKVGQTVDLETPLCILEESVTAGTGSLDSSSVDMLMSLSRNSPKAKFVGKVERIEVLYNGDVEDMSEDLKKIVAVSDRRLKSKEKIKGTQVTSGKVGNNMRVDNQPLSRGKAVINIYILGEEPLGPGDKLAVAHQLKTIVRHVHKRPMVTDDGMVIDINFGAMALDARMVNSAIIVGTTTSLLEAGTNRAVKAYFGE